MAVTINDLRIKRAGVWNSAKAFLDSHRTESGVLSAEDDATYSRMEKEITDLGREIARLERLDAMDREMAKPTSAPILPEPSGSCADEMGNGKGRKLYSNAFWKGIRERNVSSSEIRDVLSEGTDSEGGYLVPDEFERTLVDRLSEENCIRNHAHAITTSSGIHKIPVVAAKGSASWIDENGAYVESDDTFSQVQLDAHKLGTLIRVSEELLSDSAFDLEGYFISEFTRRISDKEEEAFIVGNGSGKPTGILNETAGADIGIATASSTAITADELIDLFHSLRSPYRKNAIWLLNDSTIKAIRKLKDGNGQYLWQPAIKDGEVSTILGKPYFTSAFMPEIAAGSRTVAFGDFSYYWIADRQGISFKRLNELYAGNGQVGFLASKRLDAKLVLSEAIKLLKMKE